MSKEEAKIKVAFWDFDGVFYPLTDSLKIAFAVAKLKSSISLHPKEFNKVAYKEVCKVNLRVVNIKDKVDVNFFELGADVRHVIVSHNSSNEFIKPMLSSMGLLEFFDEKDIHGCEELAKMPKNRSAKAIETYMKQAGATPAESVYIEDSSVNIKVARKALPEMTIIKIKRNCSGNKIKQADLCVENQVEALSELIKINKKNSFNM